MLTIHELSYMRKNDYLFQNLSFQLKPKNLLIVEGDNGSGKTTLLRLLSGFIRGTAGEIFWQDVPIAQCLHDYQQNIHYVGHQNAINRTLTLLENLQLHYHYLAIQDFKSIPYILEQLNLTPYQHCLASQLSAGLQRRLSLAKLWVKQKKIWLLDEPFNTLDKTTCELLKHHLTTHCQQNGLAIITSHQMIAINDVDSLILRLAT